MRSLFRAAMVGGLRYHPSMPARKTDARKYPTLTRTEADAWRGLHRQLARTRTLRDAMEVAAQPAPPHAKRFYAHLRSFVRTLKPPRRGTRSELYVYGKLRLRFAHHAQAAARRSARG
ncbi:MAG TPA: hypothetical protein VGG73_20515 [Vicinamibacterales bacterium]